LFLKAGAKVKLFSLLQNFFEVFFEIYFFSTFSSGNHLENLNPNQYVLNSCLLSKTVFVSESGCKYTTIFYPRKPLFNLIYISFLSC